MMRTPRRARVLNTGRVTTVGVRSEAAPRNGRRPSVDVERKQRIMDVLVDEPTGVSTAELASELELDRNAVYRLLDQLQCEGLIASTGRGPGARWVAEV